MRGFQQRVEQLRFAAVQRERNMVGLRAEERPFYTEHVRPQNPIRNTLHGDQTAAVITVGSNGIQVFTA